MTPFYELIDERTAAWAAAVGVGAAAAFKVFYRAKHDRRADGVDKEQQGGYSEAFRNLRAEVERLGDALKSLSGQLEQEIRLRREAEFKNFRYERRIEQLEGQVVKLGGTIDKP